MITYNLMTPFRIFVLLGKTQKIVSLLRYRTFVVGAFFEKINDRLVLKIALSKKETSGSLDYEIIQKYLNILLNFLMRNLALIEVNILIFNSVAIKFHQSAQFFALKSNIN